MTMAQVTRGMFQARTDGRLLAKITAEAQGTDLFRILRCQIVQHFPRAIGGTVIHENAFPTRDLGRRQAVTTSRITVKLPGNVLPRNTGDNYWYVYLGAYDRPVFQPLK
jgi:hypothetical protein